MLNKPLIYGILTLLLVNFLFLSIKPPLFFIKHVPKSFGTRKNETILPYYSVALLFGIIIYIHTILFS